MRNFRLFPRTTARDPQMTELFTALNDAHFALRQATARFNATTEPELVDACIYEINAVESRYNYLLRIIKERGGEAAAITYTEGNVTWV